MRKCVVRADQTIDNVEHDQVYKYINMYIYIYMCVCMYICVCARTHPGIIHSIKINPTHVITITKTQAPCSRRRAGSTTPPMPIRSCSRYYHICLYRIHIHV